MHQLSCHPALEPFLDELVTLARTVSGPCDRVVLTPAALDLVPGLMRKPGKLEAYLPARAPLTRPLFIEWLALRVAVAAESCSRRICINSLGRRCGIEPAGARVGPCQAVARSAARNSRGDLPVQRLQAWLNELGSSKPSSQAIREIGRRASSRHRTSQARPELLQDLEERHALFGEPARQGSLAHPEFSGDDLRPRRAVGQQRRDGVLDHDTERADIASSGVEALVADLEQDPVQA